MNRRGEERRGEEEEEKEKEDEEEEGEEKRTDLLRTLHFPTDVIMTTDDVIIGPLQSRRHYRRLQLCPKRVRKFSFFGKFISLFGKRFGIVLHEDTVVTKTTPVVFRLFRSTVSTGFRYGSLSFFGKEITFYFF